VIPTSTLKLRQDVTLIRLAVEHAPKMSVWMEDPAVSQNIGLRSKPSLEKTIQWINNALKSQDIYPYAILLKGQYVGNVIIDRIDRYLDMGRLSVYIGEPNARGSRVGLTGIYLALKECFSSLSLNKVWVTVHVRNIASILTFNRLGFSVEGLLRDEFILDGKRLSVLYMGLLRDEFPLFKNNQEENQGKSF